MSKLFLFAAPSGAGKTTIVRHLLREYDQLAFSVSATTRSKREYEQEGVHYYFLSPERFRELAAQNAFVEWEEVYKGLCYGTLKSEVERLWAAGRHILFDIDVKGALNIKRQYPDQAVAIFVQPPSIKALGDRLKIRGTEDAATLAQRLARASEELAYANQFDHIIVNDILAEALAEAEQLIKQYS